VTLTTVYLIIITHIENQIRENQIREKRGKIMKEVNVDGKKKETNNKYIKTFFKY